MRPALDRQLKVPQTSSLSQQNSCSRCLSKEAKQNLGRSRVRTHLGLALSGQNLQRLQVRQTLKFIKQHPVVGDHLLLSIRRLFLCILQLLSLLGLPQNLDSTPEPTSILQFQRPWKADRSQRLTWDRVEFLFIRPLVFLKPGSPSAITSMVFLPMNSRASRPPVITVFPWEQTPVFQITAGGDLLPVSRADQQEPTLTVVWTTLVSEDSIPIAPPTADDPSCPTLSPSGLPPPSPVGSEQKRFYVWTSGTNPLCGGGEALTLLPLLLFHLSGQFGGTGNSQRRLCLLDHLAEPLSWPGSSRTRSGQHRGGKPRQLPTQTSCRSFWEQKKLQQLKRRKTPENEAAAVMKVKKRYLVFGRPSREKVHRSHCTQSCGTLTHSGHSGCCCRQERFAPTAPVSPPALRHSGITGSLKIDRRQEEGKNRATKNML